MKKGANRRSPRAPWQPSRRETFALAALAAMVNRVQSPASMFNRSHKEMAEGAVEYADRLILALDGEPPQPRCCKECQT